MGSSDADWRAKRRACADQTKDKIFVLICSVDRPEWNHAIREIVKWDFFELEGPHYFFDTVRVKRAIDLGYIDRTNPTAEQIEATYNALRLEEV